MSDSTTYEGWVAVFESGTDYEADLVRDRLDHNGMPAVVLTQRDHAFNLTYGKMATVYVMVPPEHEEAAKVIVAEAPVSDADLEEAAMSADPNEPAAHADREEAALDSGIDKLSFDIPGDTDSES